MKLREAINSVLVDRLSIRLTQAKRRQATSEDFARLLGNHRGEIERLEHKITYEIDRIIREYLEETK